MTKKYPVKGTTRMIGGKRFYLAYSTTSKKKAGKYADSLRKKGFKARIRKAGSLHQVFADARWWHQY